MVLAGALFVGSLWGAGDREELSLRLRFRGGGERGEPLLSGDGSLAGGGRFLAATCNMLKLSLLNHSLPDNR